MILALALCAIALASLCAVIVVTVMLYRDEQVAKGRRPPR